MGHTAKLSSYVVLRLVSHSQTPVFSFISVWEKTGSGIDGSISVQPSVQFRVMMIGDNDGFLDLLKSVNIRQLTSFNVAAFGSAADPRSRRYRQSSPTLNWVEG